MGGAGVRLLVGLGVRIGLGGKARSRAVNMAMRGLWLRLRLKEGGWDHGGVMGRASGGARVRDRVQG